MTELMWCKVQVASMIDFYFYINDEICFAFSQTSAFSFLFSFGIKFPSSNLFLEKCFFSISKDFMLWSRYSAQFVSSTFRVVVECPVSFTNHALKKKTCQDEHEEKWNLFLIHGTREMKLEFAIKFIFSWLVVVNTSSFEEERK